MKLEVILPAVKAPPTQAYWTYVEEEQRRQRAKGPEIRVTDL